MTSDEEDLEESYVEGYSNEPIMEAKDPYSFRSLPHRIGTAEFLSEDDVGLREYISEEEDELETGGLYDTDDESVSG